MKVGKCCRTSHLRTNPRLYCRRTSGPGPATAVIATPSGAPRKERQTKCAPRSGPAGDGLWLRSTSFAFRASGCNSRKPRKSVALSAPVHLFGPLTASPPLLQGYQIASHFRLLALWGDFSRPLHAAHTPAWFRGFTARACNLSPASIENRMVAARGAYTSSQARELLPRHRAPAGPRPGTRAGAYSRPG